MGCASVPDSQATDGETGQSPILGIAQVRGTPDHFLVCANCPAPTQKTTFRRSAHRAKTQSGKHTQRELRKLVVHFDHASSVLKQSDQDALARLVDALPEFYRLTITGYTDNTTTGGTIDNKTLARQRARSVMDYLSGLGVDENNIVLKVSPLCCYIAPNTTESDRAKNRRTEIIVTSLSKEGINP
ncbi:MAG: OmpA family protein [Gammaproteobacteria bacterium]